MTERWVSRWGTVVGGESPSVSEGQEPRTHWAPRVKTSSGTEGYGCRSTGPSIVRVQDVPEHSEGVYVYSHRPKDLYPPNTPLCPPCSTTWCR